MIQYTASLNEIRLINSGSVTVDPNPSSETVTATVTFTDTSTYVWTLGSMTLSDCDGRPYILNYTPLTLSVNDARSTISIEFDENSTAKPDDCPEWSAYTLTLNNPPSFASIELVSGDVLIDCTDTSFTEGIVTFTITISSGGLYPSD